MKFQKMSVFLAVEYSFAWFTVRMLNKIHWELIFWKKLGMWFFEVFKIDSEFNRHKNDGVVCMLPPVVGVYVKKRAIVRILWSPFLSESSGTKSWLSGGYSRKCAHVDIYFTCIGVGLCHTISIAICRSYYSINVKDWNCDNQHTNDDVCVWRNAGISIAQFLEVVRCVPVAEGNPFPK